jgi:nucleoside-diphosphate-sugar epimerase
MRVAVTGTSGFIGTALVPILRSRGYEVRPVAREATAAGESFAGVDAVVHLANVAHGRASPSCLHEVNVAGTRAVASAAAARGVRRLVYLSSVKAVAEESGARALTAADRPAPRDAYGRSKLAAEQALNEVAEASGMEAVVLRPPLVYGPGVKANFLALLRMIDRGWPLPLAAIRNRRSLVYVGNLCDAIAASCVSPSAARRAFFVTDGPAVSTPELCRAIAQALGRRARLFPFPSALLPVSRLTRSLELDDGELRRDLGWRPPYSFKQGLEATAGWYRSR